MGGLHVYIGREHGRATRLGGLHIYIGRKHKAQSSGAASWGDHTALGATLRLRGCVLWRPYASWGDHTARVRGCVLGRPWGCVLGRPYASWGDHTARVLLYQCHHEVISVHSYQFSVCIHDQCAFYISSQCVFILVLRLSSRALVQTVQSSRAVLVLRPSSPLVHFSVHTSRALLGPVPSCTSHVHVQSSHALLTMQSALCTSHCAALTVQFSPGNPHYALPVQWAQYHCTAGGHC